MLLTTYPHQCTHACAPIYAHTHTHTHTHTRTHTHIHTHTHAHTHTHTHTHTRSGMRDPFCVLKVDNETIGRYELKSYNLKLHLGGGGGDTIIWIGKVAESVYD